MAVIGKRKRWNWLAWLALLAIVGLVVMQRLSASRAASGTGLPVGVEIAKTEVGTQQQKISSTGVVASQIGTQVKIGSQITGRIIALPFDVGSYVKAGQVVARLDLPDLQAQVDQQRHSVTAAEASFAQSQSRYKQALESSGFTSEQTAAQIAEANAALRAAKAKVDSSQASARLQPIQTRTDILRAQAALSSSLSAQKQVAQTIRQQIQQTQASLDDAQVAADNAKRSFGRQKQLLDKGFIAQEVVDQAESTYKQTLARLENMKATLDITREKTRADTQSAQDQVDQAKASLTAVQAETLQDTVREADLRNAIESQGQAKAALVLQQANHRQDKIKEMAIEESRNAMLQAQANVQQSKSQLKYQLDQLDKTIIHSPISGTVLSITAQQGETVAAGLAAPTLITVADLRRLEVRAYVDETDIGHIRLGLPAEARVEAFPGHIFRGKVTKIASASTIKDNVITYETTIAINNAEGLLRPDMTADVSLILGEHKNVLLVPSESVHRETRRSIVYVLHANLTNAERVEVREVAVGFDDGARTEIKKGLKGGETVVVAGLPRLGVRASDSPSERSGK